jgi:hypothetical protein
MFHRRPAVALIALSLVFGGIATGCGDDPGEDEIGDGEINDEGD